MNENILLRGVRVNNLKNVSLDVPLDKLIVVTGVSGSGKSSLAFDTLYAEGQRRYIESLSSYARQFLERMDKPDADLIDGIPPAIAIQQKAATKNPRSTVATVTEAYDYLRVLYARIGTVHCLQCGRPVGRDTIDGMAESLFKLPAGTALTVSFPWPAEKGGGPLKKLGFYRLLIDGAAVPLEEARPAKTGTLDVFVDRLNLDPEDRDRLVDSLELGLKHGGGRVRVDAADGRILSLLRQARVQILRHPLRRSLPQPVLLQQPAGRLPRLPRLRRPGRHRRGEGRSRTEQEPEGRGHRALDQARLQGDHEGDAQGGPAKGIPHRRPLRTG